MKKTQRQIINDIIFILVIYLILGLHTLYFIYNPEIFLRILETDSDPMSHALLERYKENPERIVPDQIYAYFITIGIFTPFWIWLSITKYKQIKKELRE